jgi:hypothetical protein
VVEKLYVLQSAKIFLPVDINVIYSVIWELVNKLTKLILVEKYVEKKEVTVNIHVPNFVILVNSVNLSPAKQKL